MYNPRTIFLTGIALVVVGIVLGIAAVDGSTTVVRFIPLIAGIAVCLAGAVNRAPGWYLPGVIIVGIGVGLLIVSSSKFVPDDSRIAGVFLVCCGCGLAVLPVLSRLTGWDAVLWPLYPAAVLIAAGFGLLFLAPQTGMGRFVGRVWRPIVALSVAYIVIVFFRRSKL